MVVCVTMTAASCLTVLALLCRDASCPFIFLAVAGSVGFVVPMALPRHPNPHKQSPVS